MNLSLLAESDLWPNGEARRRCSDAISAPTPEQSARIHLPFEVGEKLSSDELPGVDRCHRRRPRPLSLTQARHTDKVASTPKRGTEGGRLGLGRRPGPGRCCPASALLGRADHLRRAVRAARAGVPRPHSRPTLLSHQRFAGPLTPPLPELHDVTPLESVVHAPGHLRDRQRGADGRVGRDRARLHLADLAHGWAVIVVAHGSRWCAPPVDGPETSSPSTGTQQGHHGQPALLVGLPDNGGNAAG